MKSMSSLARNAMETSVLQTRANKEEFLVAKFDEPTFEVVEFPADLLDLGELEGYSFSIKDGMVVIDSKELERAGFSYIKVDNAAIVTPIDVNVMDQVELGLLGKRLSRHFGKGYGEVTKVDLD